MRQRRNGLAVAGLAALWFVRGTGAAHAQFQAVDLDALGGEAHGSAAEQQVGEGLVMAPGYYGAFTPIDHAMLWTGHGSSSVDLNPFSGWSEALATDGQHQVGDGEGTSTGQQSHALLWSGTAASVVDLHPVGWTQSVAAGVSGGRQVGYATQIAAITGGRRGATSQNVTNAFLWSGTAASAVNLNPAGMSQSEALGIGGNQQVGWGLSPTTGSSQAALLWTGSAAGAVNLNPAGYNSSEALGTDGARQVGYASILVPAYYGNALNSHAFLWCGTAASAVDLNPAGYLTSQANAIYGSRQVGAGSARDPFTGLVHTHALMWSGTAASAVDLNAFLPAGFTDAQADGIDAAGNIVGSASGRTGTVPVLWLSSLAPPTPPVIVAPPVGPPAPTPPPSGGGSGGGGGGGGGGGNPKHSPTGA